jgi:two-component system sensor histidine kinase/response regulator
MKDKVKCWELFNCLETECPVHQSNKPRCWLATGTHCRKEIQGRFLEKIEMCLACEVFKANVDVDSMDETLSVCDAQFREFRKMVEDRDGELEGVSMELAVGLSEVFQALNQIASGDPDVRIPEDSEIELLVKLKSMVNRTAEGMGEIVGLSHEFAMGLAEHFDILRRVSEGDLNARVSGTSQVELLESLKVLTNRMISSVSGAITERKQTGDQLKHVNAVLRAMRKINHLITREASRDNLLQGACEGLIETVGYHNAWIALLDQSGNVTASANAGLDDSFALMAEQLKRGELPGCARRALGQSRAVVIKEPAAECTDCPMAGAYADRGALSVRLEHEGKVYGLMTVSVPVHFVGSSEELALFEQVAGDMAFGLYRIDLEEKQRKWVQTLHESEERLRTITASAQDAIIMMDDQGNISFWNRSAERIFGYSPEEALGKELHMLLAPPRYAEAYAKGMAGFRQTGQGSAIGKTLEWTALKKDGREFPVEISLSAVRQQGKWSAIGIMRDITERKQAEESMRKSEKKYRTIFELSPEAILLLDEKGDILEVNARIHDSLSYNPQEVLGKNLMELPYLPEESKAIIKEKFSERMTGKKVPPYELEFTSRDGKRLIGRVIGTSIEDGNSGTRQDLVMISDITESKRAQEALLLAKQEAEAANVAKSEFLANMSHEIRTPMNAIIGMTDLALDSQLTTEQREYLQTVKASGDSLLTLINDILDLSKIESRKLELDLVDFNLRDTVGDTLKTLAVRADEKRLELACRILPDVPEVLVGDPGRLRQILMNLAGNAIKFTERGEVVMRVERESETEDKICLHFTVSDTGLGIPVEKQRLIFEPFVQVDGSTTRKYGGTGLGLTITRHLVEMMGGEIRVESREGKGTSLRFSAHFDLSKKPFMEPPAFEPFDIRGLRVLVVDDNATNRRILEEILANRGMKAAGASNARRALAAMEQAKGLGLPYALVLLDAVMPGMDGFALAEEVRKRPGLVGVVIMMLTSAGERGDAARCRELGISAYLIKPIKQSDLLNTIMAVLAYKQKHGKRPPLITRHSLREIQGAHRVEAGRPLKILAAEDNAVNQLVVSRILEKRGHSVMLAKNGEEVLAALDKDTFDVVLMDIQMPGMDGLQATKAIRERESALAARNGQRATRIPIIALTAHAMKGDRERCLEAGMDSYVSKPIRAEALFAELDKLTVGSPDDDKRACLASDHDEQGDEDVFDLSKALEVVDGDRALLKEIADLFLEDMPGSMTQLREGITKGEASTVELVAHRLKGSVATLGAKRASEAAYGLELMGKQAILAEAEGAVSKLETELEQLKVAMQGSLE